MPSPYSATPASLPGSSTWPSTCRGGGNTPDHSHPLSGGLPGRRQQGWRLHHHVHSQPAGATDALRRDVWHGAGPGGGAEVHTAKQEDAALCAAAGCHLLGAVCDHLRDRGGVWAIFLQQETLMGSRVYPLSVAGIVINMKVCFRPQERMA